MTGAGVTERIVAAAKARSTHLSSERATAMQQRLLYWLSWTVMAGAVLVVCAAGWLLWEVQGRTEMLFRGNTHMLPLLMRTLLAIPAVLFTAVPLAVSAGCVAVQTRLPSRVIATLFHLSAAVLGLGCFLVAQQAVTASLLAQTFVVR